MKIDYKKLGLIGRALEYFESKPDFETAWEECESGYWMLVVAYKLHVNNKLYVLAAGYCANTVREHMHDPRSRNAVDAAIAYGNGTIDEQELKLAAKEARKVMIDYSAVGAAEAAYWAAEAADWAVRAADWAVRAADWATSEAAKATYWAVEAAYWAASEAYYSAGKDEAARIENQHQTADIYRELLTPEVMAMAKKIEIK